MAPRLPSWLRRRLGPTSARPAGYALLALAAVLALGSALPARAQSLVLAGSLQAARSSDAWIARDLAGKSVTALDVSPTDSSLLIAAVPDSGLYRSVDGGKTWTQVNTGLTSLRVNDVRFDPWNPDIVYAAAGGGPEGDPGGGLFRSSDGGQTWSRRLQGDVLGIGISRQNRRVVYAVGPFAPKVWKSADRGLTWLASGQGIDPNVDIDSIAVSPTNPDVALVGGTTEGGTGGIFRTVNGGASWAAVYSGAGSSVPTAVSHMAFNSQGRITYATTVSGVLRSTNAGRSFTTLRTGSVYSSVQTSPTSTYVIFLGTTDGRVLYSLNGGGRFYALGGSVGHSIQAIAVSQVGARVVYVGTSDGVFAHLLPLLNR